MEFEHISILSLVDTYDKNLKLLEDLLTRKEWEKEKETIQRFRDFIENSKNHFSRENTFGHFTGSAWLLSPCQRDVVLTHHKKLGKWIQLGGHADGNRNLANVAYKEAIEESGLLEIEILKNKNCKISAFDLSIHEIPTYKDVEAHLHFDLCFLFQAKGTNLICSSESHAVEWLSIDKAILRCTEETSYSLKKLNFFLKKEALDRKTRDLNLPL